MSDKITRRFVNSIKRGLVWLDEKVSPPDLHWGMSAFAQVAQERGLVIETLKSEKEELLKMLERLAMLATDIRMKRLTPQEEAVAVDIIETEARFLLQQHREGE